MHASFTLKSDTELACRVHKGTYTYVMYTQTKETNSLSLSLKS